MTDKTHSGILAEFVGGPWDGERRVFAPHVREVYVPLSQPVAVVEPLTAEMASVRIGRYVAPSAAIFTITDTEVLNIGESLDLIIFQFATPSPYHWQGER